MAIRRKVKGKKQKLEIWHLPFLKCVGFEVMVISKHAKLS